MLSPNLRVARPASLAGREKQRRDLILTLFQGVQQEFPLGATGLDIDQLTVGLERLRLQVGIDLLQEGTAIDGDGGTGQTEHDQRASTVRWAYASPP